MKTGVFPVYERLPQRNKGKRGKVSEELRFFKGVPAVYIIRKAGKIVYIGSSTVDVYTTALRHFQFWNDLLTDKSVRWERKYYGAKDATLQIIAIDNATRQEIHALEAKMIEEFKPRDNKAGNYSFFNHKFPVESEPEFSAGEIAAGKDWPTEEYEEPPF